LSLCFLSFGGFLFLVFREGKRMKGGFFWFLLLEGACVEVLVLFVALFTVDRAVVFFFSVVSFPSFICFLLTFHLDESTKSINQTKKYTYQKPQCKEKKKIERPSNQPSRFLN